MERYTISYTAGKGTRFGIWKGETLIKGDFATEKEAKAHLNTILNRAKSKGVSWHNKGNKTNGIVRKTIT